jgi:hypothetical protein
VPPANGSAPSSGDVAELGPSAAAILRKFGKDDGAPSQEAPAAAPAVPDDRRPVATNRQEILAAFARNRTPPQPATPQPRPAQRQAEPEITEAAFDEYVAGWVIGLAP